MSAYNISKNALYNHIVAITSELINKSVLFAQLDKFFDSFG